MIEIFILRYFDKLKKIIFKTNSLNYVNNDILSQYNNNNILHSIVFYNKNLILIEYNYQIYNKELLAIIRYLKY